MAIRWVSTPSICEGPRGDLPITEWRGSFLVSNTRRICFLLESRAWT